MSNRRTFIKQITALSSLSTLAGIGVSARAFASDTIDVSWLMPDELAWHAGTYIAFGASKSIWEDWVPDVQDALGLLSKTIAAYEPVTILCRKNELEIAKAKCGSRNTRFISTPLNDIWMRDIGPVFVRDQQGKLGAVGLNFNGWGNKQTHGKDALIAELSADVALAEFIETELTGEGGGLETDGHGTAILTESSWINSNRNLGWGKNEIDAELKRLFGLRKIIWLPGIKGKDITDAHVDFYARFAAPGVVVANLDNDPKSYDYQVTRKHLEILKSATDADGRRLQIHTLSPPQNYRQTKYSATDNSYWAPGYINYYPVNGAVIAPEFGDTKADAYCNKLLSSLYPDRKIVQINIDAIAAGGGGIHCVTCHQPAITEKKYDAI